jgi:hypothetical protein
MRIGIERLAVFIFSASLFSSIFASFFWACDDLPWGSCTCTEMECPDGVSVELLHKPDTNQFTDLKVSLVYADTVEAASEMWGLGGPDGHSFISRKVVNLKPRRIQVLLSYSHLGTENQITLDTSLAWTSRVCNECTGGGSCKDDMAYTALLVWDLSQVDFE